MAVKKLYAGPWIKITDQDFVRNLVDLEVARDVRGIPARLARIHGRTKRGVTTWTADVTGFSVSKFTNKKEAKKSCEDKLISKNYILLKDKHLSFL